MGWNRAGLARGLYLYRRCRAFCAQGRISVGRKVRKCMGKQEIGDWKSGKIAVSRGARLTNTCAPVDMAGAGVGRGVGGRFHCGRAAPGQSESRPIGVSPRRASRYSG